MMSLRASLRTTATMARQAFSTNVPACTADPIQELFVNKIRAYGEKKAAAGGAMVDATPETQAELQAELDKVEEECERNWLSLNVIAGCQGIRRWSWS